jgi:thiol-disulfide isomerase/thioredoxin
MFMNTSSLSLVAVALTGLAITAAPGTANAVLTVGDPAPALQIGRWIQGDPVKEFKSGTPYIVEFWATWCGPCRQSIPHLNAIYEKFKDQGLVVIGQDAWENDESLVAPFVKKMGDQMTYRVALDDKSKVEKGAMAVTWMDAAQQNGIPTAFVINKHGRIAWIGHPMALVESVLTDILADHYDMEKAATQYESDQKVQRVQQALYSKLSSSMRAKDWDAASAAVDELEKATGAGNVNIDLLRLRILVGRSDFAGATKLAESLSESYKTTPQFLNAIAWSMISETQSKDAAFLASAEKISTLAADVSQNKDPQILDTLARAQFLNGHKDMAIATEQKALDLVKDESEKALYQRALESYRKGELPTVGH